LSAHLLGVISGPLALVFILGATALLYPTYDLPEPKIPPKKVVNTLVLARKVQSGGGYGKVVRKDAKEWGIDRDDVTDKIMKKGHPYFSEFSGDMALEIGKSFETDHLKLSVKTEKIELGEEGMAIATDHMIMEIENKTDKYLAYQVRTTIEGKCASKAVFAQNALGIKPKETIRRTECLPNGPGELRILKVEVMELTQLGYYYVSRLDPERLFMDPRSTEGHQIPMDKTCNVLPWRAIHQAVKKGGAGWRDVIDFYARHNCDTYFFYPSYRYKEEGLETLPSKAPE